MKSLDQDHVFNKVQLDNQPKVSKQLTINFVNSEQVSLDDQKAAKIVQSFEKLYLEELKQLREGGLLGKINQVILNKNNYKSP